MNWERWVTGAVAQVLQANGRLTPAQVKFALQYSAQPMKGYGLIEQGAGSLNVPLAVSLGDPAGVGPEIVAKAWQWRQSAATPKFFAIGDLDSARVYQTNMSLAADTFHELIIPPNMVNEKGQLIVNFINRNETAVLFPLEEGMEVLYREGGFGLNYLRGVLIIFFWLAFLGALGLAASSFLSFPVAAFLSGGLDSSAVVASMALVSRGGASPHAFTARYSGSDAARTDETALARALADRYGARLTVVDVAPNLGDVFERIAYALDEPHADDSALPTWALSAAVAREYKVALTGIGGDELFAGYSSYKGIRFAEHYKRVPRWLGRQRLPGLGRAVSSTTETVPVRDVHRIDEAAKFIPLDQLCLSPQCGFASTEEGNVLAEEEQWAKLRMVVELADEVWG